MAKSKNDLSRKEKRKQERKAIKQNRNSKKIEIAQPKIGPLKKILHFKKELLDKDNIDKGSISSNRNQKYVDPYIDAEEKEIQRLSKLLGFDKNLSKKKIAGKLNKEFQLYEGIGEDFGDFLNDLDELTEVLEGKVELKNKKGIFYKGELESDDDDSVFAKEDHYANLIDDDQQEQSDIDSNQSNEDDIDMDIESGETDESHEVKKRESRNDNAEDKEEEEEEEEEGEEEEEEDGRSNFDQDDINEDELEEDDDDNNNNGQEEDDDDDDANSKNDNVASSNDEYQMKELFTYKPIEGEDIYGRSVPLNGDKSGNNNKYVPPAKRKAALMEIDDSSEKVVVLKRQLNGLMNKLSEQSKDTIIRSIKKIFDQNSVTLSSLVLKDTILAACSNPTQLMTSLIPIYAGIVAALHCTIGIDVGAFMIESLATVLHKSIGEATMNPNNKDSAISSKLPANALLLLVYLYNLRIVHHTLIVDIMKVLADSSTGEFAELKIELLECLINHCGVSIRSDDPISLKNVIQTLHKNLGHLLKSRNSDIANNLYENSRLRFMFEALTDLKNNKSRRIQTANAEVVKKLRKWIGSIKSTLGQHQHHQSGDTCLRVSLQDLLNAESSGRWWRTGASWVGRTMTPFELEASNNNSPIEQKQKLKRLKNKSNVNKTEQDHLIELAEKLGMNTITRKKIFVVMMSSRDVTDAFERLSRLELKGKEDREVARILSQCCGQEKSYNGFYAELAKVLCTQERQYKITFKFVFWDMFKAISEDDDEDDGDDPMCKSMNERRIVNLARMLSSLICSFHISLSIIKPIEITNITPLLVLFLSTLLLAIFKEKISEEDFQNILDRVATTKDFAIVRDNIMFFLQRYIPDIPIGLEKEDTKRMKMRRKVAIKTFEAMTVLDISRGLMKDDDEI